MFWGFDPLCGQIVPSRWHFGASASEGSPSVILWANKASPSELWNWASVIGLGEIGPSVGK